MRRLFSEIGFCYADKLKTIFLVIQLIIFQFIGAQSIFRQKISLDVKDKTIEDIILMLQNSHGIPFSYSKSLIKMDAKVNKQYNSVEVGDLLNDLFRNMDIMYTYKSGIFILQPKPQNLDKILLTGIVKNQDNGIPVEYAGVKITYSGKWCYTDKDGRFVLQVQKSELNDSIEISSVGFNSSRFLASGFTQNTHHIVFLEPQAIQIQPVNIRARDFRNKMAGNSSLFSFGSIYIDTQGQQTALFIPNKKGRKGIIESLHYYLSDKGNVSCPFRVRIYKPDTLKACPGEDLLENIVIARPKGSGWHKINILEFNIDIPENGFFVAIEGIYPLNMKDDVEYLQEPEYPNTISYGQRLGYSRKKGEDTWHYSLAHQWFQLKEDNYHVMMYAKIQYRRKHLKLE